MATFRITQRNTIVRQRSGEKRPVNSDSHFASESELITLTSDWPSRRLVEIWNKLAGVTPVLRFTSRRRAAIRIWREINTQHAPQKAIRQLPQNDAPPAQQTKGEHILALLIRPSGANLAEIIAATGWQPHSVRGFISAQIGKRMGYVVQSFEKGGMRVYRIPPNAAHPAKTGPKPRHRAIARKQIVSSRDLT